MTGTKQQLESVNGHLTRISTTVNALSADIAQMDLSSVNAESVRHRQALEAENAALQRRLERFENAPMTINADNSRRRSLTEADVAIVAVAIILEAQANALALDVGADLAVYEANMQRAGELRRVVECTREDLGRFDPIDDRAHALERKALALAAVLCDDEEGE